MLVFHASFIRITRLISGETRVLVKTPLIAWTHVSPCYIQFNGFGVKEAEKQEEGGGVRESSRAENGRGFQPVIEGESCYRDVFWLLAILQIEPLPKNVECEGDKEEHEVLSRWTIRSIWLDGVQKKKVVLLTSRKHNNVHFSLSYETDVFSALHMASLLWKETHHLAICLF